MIQTKDDRINICNEIIIEISSYDRQFFKTDDIIAHFIIKNNRIYFIDDYTQRQISISGDWIKSRYFSHGGTLNSLIIEMKDFIINGKINESSKLYGAYDTPYYYGWGYSSSNIDKIINKAKELNYLN